MIKITIRLVGQEKDILYEGIDIDPQIYIYDVVMLVKKVTKIPENYQEIHFRGEELPDTCHPFESIKEFEEIIVKHTSLDRWSLYRTYVENVKKRVKYVVDNAERAVKHHQYLMEDGFFDVYPDFEEYRRKHHPEIAAWVGGVLELMVNDVSDHFLFQHRRQGGKSLANFKYNWNPRIKDMSGTLKGITAYVQLHKEEQPTKYLIECNHNAISSKEFFLDIIKMFCYKILELLEVGPAVQFILRPQRRGKRITYIACTWRDDFIPLSKLTDKSEFSIEALIQLRLLNVLLFIGDLHGDNCGQWKSTDNAAVVDPIPLPYATYPDVKRAVHAPFELAWDDVPRKLLLEHPQQKFWDIARKSLDKWNLLDKIKQANELITEELACESKYTVTNDLDNHLDAVIANLEKLLNELGLSQ
ncbi:unnamed protein product [Auanema sp. JU1783]|nr:unnamed protein product [Auanema sp. JU1783]